MNDQATDLLRDLVAALCSKPEEARVDYIPGEGDLGAFRVKVADCDTGRVFGRDFSHLFALKFIVQRMAARARARWSLSIADRAPGAGDERSEYPPPPQAYDPEGARALLEDAVNAVISDNASVAAGNGHKPHNFVFTIRADTRDGAAELTTPFSVTGAREPLSAQSALGTLWRAIGRQEGVTFRVEVPAE